MGSIRNVFPQQNIHSYLKSLYNSFKIHV